MLAAGRLLALLAVAFAAAADTPPSSDAPPAVAAAVPASDEELRSVFVGKAACPPQPWPVGIGPHEFLPNGDYVRARDLASAHGRYTVSNGRICITLAGSSAADFCFAVLKRNGSWLFRLEGSTAGARPHEATLMEPCPLP